jgi:CRISPR-associated protein Csb2
MFASAHPSRCDEQGGAHTSIDPDPCSRAGVAPAGSVFGESLVLKVLATAESPVALRLAQVEDVTRALRGALLHHATDPPPAVLSGHLANGRPLERPHAAFLALPDLSSRSPAATVTGAVILLPREVSPGDRAAVLTALARWERRGFRLLLGRMGAVRLERIRGSDAIGAFAPEAWTRASGRWASVTPVALDRNPGDLRSGDAAVAARAVRAAEETVARACENSGLPRPAYARVMRRSLFTNAPPAPAFMPYPRHGSGFKRVCVHAELHFAEPVAGPVVLGVGRYFGVGMFGRWQAGFGS